MYRFAQQSGAVQWRGAPCHFTAGEAWHEADPFVRAHPHLFGDTPPKVRGEAPADAESGRIERATRRPGERRG